VTATDGCSDLVIAGGGLAGATLALALRKRLPQLKIAVIEQFPLSDEVALPLDYQPSYDARSTALSWGSRCIFESLGLWDDIAQQATPIRGIHVSERGRFGVTRLSAQEHGQDALGYVVDNRWMGLCLTRALAADGGLEWLAPAQVETVRRGPSEQGNRQSFELTLAGEVRSSIHTRQLVIADGGRSDLREQLGFRVNTTRFGQQALIANISTSEAHEFVAYERFTDQGPLALLPRGSAQRSEGESSLVWTQPDTSADDVLAMSDAERCTYLQARFGWRLGRIERIGTLYHYPLTLSLVDEFVQPGIALIGNAAHSLHPVAGQGFNLALRGIERLVHGLGQAQSDSKADAFRFYIESHRQDVSLTAAASTELVRLFGSRNPVLGLARDLGLAGLDVATPLKRSFARRAMGLVTPGRG